MIEDRLGITDISNDAKGFFTTSAEDKIAFSNVGEPTFKDLLEGSDTGSDGNIAGTFTITAGDDAGQIGNISFEKFETITFEVKDLKNDFVQGTRNNDTIDAAYEGDPDEDYVDTKGKYTIIYYVIQTNGANFL